MPEDQAGSEEDAGADNGSDEEEEEVAGTEGAGEGGHAEMIVEESGCLVVKIDERVLHCAGRRVCTAAQSEREEKASARSGRMTIFYWVELFEKWGGHEAEDEDDECDDGAEAAGGVEGLWIEDGDEAKETDDEEERTPNVPARPEMERSEGDEDERKDP